MKKESVESCQAEYPSSDLKVISRNRFTLLGTMLVLISPSFSFSESDFVRLIGLEAFMVGGFFLGVTNFGQGTLYSYKRTIDFYRRKGPIPPEYDKRAKKGFYCDKVGYLAAKKDIKRGLV